MPTIRDVAAKAGVSVPTVSRVLNGRAVAEELRTRVTSAIADLGYRPSRLARRLRSGDHKLVGAILSDISNPFYIQALHGTEDVLSDRNISVLVSNANSDPLREAKLVDLMSDEGVSGLLIAPTREDPRTIELAHQRGMAVVVLDRTITGVQVDTVVSDNFNAARRAVEHLIGLGHRRIAMINGPLHLSTARDRYSGYLHALSSADIPPDPSLTRFGDFRMQSGYDLTLELLAEAERPTAIFVSNNEMTIGALNAIHWRALAIPDDIAIIGFDDFPWSNSLNPPLTTVAQAPVAMGATAANLVLDRIKDPDRPTRTEILPTELVIRRSCGAAMPTSLQC